MSFTISLGSSQIRTAIIAGGIIMGFGLAIRHVQGLFLLPMTMDRGWSREDFALAIAVQNLSWGVTQPIAGMIIDRWSALPVLIVGTFIYAAGLLCMSVVTTPMGLLLSAGIMIGIAQSCTAFGAVYAAISRLVPESVRSVSLGKTGALGGLCQFIAVPVVQQMQFAKGWDWTLVALGVVIAMTLPLCVLLRPRPSMGGSTATARNLPMSVALRRALHHRGFRLLTLGFFACGFQLAFIGSHLPAYLVDKGLPASVAATGLAIIALSNVAGTYLAGSLGAVYRPKYMLAAVYAARAIAILIFIGLPPSAITTYLFCAVVGVLWLGTLPLTNNVIAQIFGIRYIATLFGVTFLSHQIGSFLGVWLGGLAFERTHSYDLVWMLAIGFGVLAAVCHWPIDDRSVQASDDAALPSRV